MRSTVTVRHIVIRPAKSAGTIGVVVASVVAATVFGIALPTSPWTAVSVLVLLPLGLVAPTASVMAILAITVLVPWDLQNQLKLVGGEGHRGVLFVDALLILALLRSAWLIGRRRLKLDLPMVLGGIIFGILAAAVVWGIASGADASAAGNEGRRTLFGAGAFLLAWPLMRDRTACRRVIAGLCAIGLALGMWGLAQWVFDVGYSAAGDVGIRGGLSSGQLQGGMYAYPVAVVLAWSGLTAGAIRSVAVKTLLAVILAANIVCVFLTFERTIVVCTALACVMVVVTADATARRHAMRWSALVAVLLTAGGVIAEAQVRTAFERLTLLGNVGSDNSFSHRLIESDVITGQITSRPFVGSGFGAAVTWGVRDKFATSTTTFADLGYHWLAWKIGLPAAVMIALILWRAVFRRSRVIDNVSWHALRMGSRAALLAVLLIGVLFGVFDALGITAVIGLLAAICYSEPTESAAECGPDDHSARRGEPNDDPDRVTVRVEGAS